MTPRADHKNPNGSGKSSDNGSTPPSSDDILREAEQLQRGKDPVTVSFDDVAGGGDSWSLPPTELAELVFATSWDYAADVLGESRLKIKEPMRGISIECGAKTIEQFGPEWIRTLEPWQGLLLAQGIHALTCFPVWLAWMKPKSKPSSGGEDPGKAPS